MADKYLNESGLQRFWNGIKAKFAPLASPALTGTPTAPTANSGTATTQIATTEFVADEIDNLEIGGANILTNGMPEFPKSDGTWLEGYTMSLGDGVTYGKNISPNYIYFRTPTGFTDDELFIGQLQKHYYNNGSLVSEANKLELIEGHEYTFSVELKTSTIIEAGYTLYVMASSSSTGIYAANRTENAVTVPATNEWVRLSWTFTVPSGWTAAYDAHYRSRMLIDVRGIEGESDFTSPVEVKFRHLKIEEGQFATGWRRSDADNDIATVNAIPTSLKNPNKLTIVLNGTTYEYDGSSAVTITINSGDGVSY